MEFQQYEYKGLVDRQIQTINRWESDHVRNWAAPIGRKAPPSHTYIIQMGNPAHIYGMYNRNLVIDKLCVWVSRVIPVQIIYPYFLLSDLSWGPFVVRDLLKVLGKVYPITGKRNPGIGRVRRAVQKVAVAYAYLGPDKSGLIRARPFTVDDWTRACRVDEQAMKWRYRNGLESKVKYNQMLDEMLLQSRTM